MKINITQADQVKFKVWSWWSDWIDISIVPTSLEFSSYLSNATNADLDVKSALLQMKISRLNKKKFNVVAINASIDVSESLTSMSGVRRKRRTQKETAECVK